MPVLKTQKDKLKQIMKKQKLPQQLQQHSLSSLSVPVLVKYQDRPFKLRNHLPFAVDYDNTAFPSRQLEIPEQQKQQIF